MKENITENIKVLTVFSIIHFIVDFSCIYIVYNLFLDNSVDYKLKISMLIIYNFFAFFMQAPFGIIIDKLGGSFKYSALGCIFIFLSVFFAKYKIISVMILGIGNALFHLGGGVEILNRAERKATMPGIFVSTGAFGLFLGARFTAGVNIVYAMLLVSAAVLMLCDVFCKGEQQPCRGEQKSCSGEQQPCSGERLSEPVTCVFISALILFICIIIRSFVGMISIYPWKNIFVYALSLTLATVLGKFFGGILSDKFTAKRTTFVSLFLSASLYIFAANYPIAGILATFLFNITMPITLIYISNIMDEQKGFAFGLTTLGLFFGYLPVALQLINATAMTSYIPFIVMLQNILLVSIITVIDKKNPATT